MHLSILRPASVVATLVVSGGIMAAGLTIGPALANGGPVMLGPFAIVTCNNSTACQTYKNNGTGVGLKGQTTDHTALWGYASNNGVGVDGQSVHGTGLVGSTSNGYGVFGTAQSGYGVAGLSSSALGVFGSSSSSVGVYGQSTDSSGLFGTSTNGFGIEAHASAADAVHAVNGGSGTAVAALANNGDGLYSVTAGGGVGAYIYNYSGNGADITGTYIGAIDRAPAGSGQFPLLLTDAAGNDLFFVNGNGDVFYHGTLNNFARTSRGSVALAYSSKTTSPTVEDTGSGQLAEGVAYIRLDPAFAQTIDQRTAYRVVVTPDGDTRGLFVAAKNPNGFVVREVQGGHASISFDYHIYASEAGHAGDRMVVIPPAAAQALMPRAMPVHRSVSPSTKLSIHHI